VKFAHAARASGSRLQVAHRRYARRAGQAAIEYLLVAAVTLAMVAVLGVLLYSVREHGRRVLDLVGANSP
jgi:hypothetical protein